MCITVVSIYIITTFITNMFSFKVEFLDVILGFQSISTHLYIMIQKIYKLSFFILPAAVMVIVKTSSCITGDCD